MSEQKVRTVLQEFGINKSKLNELLLAEEMLIEENMLKAVNLCKNNENIFPIGFVIPKLPLLPKFQKVTSFHLGRGFEELDKYANEPLKNIGLGGTRYSDNYAGYFCSLRCVLNSVESKKFNFIYDEVLDECLPSEIEKDFNKVVAYRKSVEKWYSDYFASVYLAYGKFYKREEKFIDRILKWLGQS